MKPPVKRDQIISQFRTRILSGALAAGSRLPTELELAGHAKVSRDTIREAMKQLEADALIERIPGKGTFVRTAAVPQNNVITFLLPCADIIADRIGYRTSFITRELLCGAMTEGGKQNLRVETIAVSPSNSNEDIDWRSLSHLNQSSRVIVFTLWYHPIFPFLAERGVKAALITLGEENHCAAYREFTDRWLRLHDDIPAVMRTADHFLREDCACEKTALIARSYAESDKGPFDFHASIPDIAPAFFRSGEDDERYRAALRSIYQRQKFDGLFLQTSYLHAFDYTRSLNENLGLPERVRILTYCETPYSTRTFPRIPALTFDFRKAGALAVKRLAAETRTAEDLAFEPFIETF